MRLAKILALGVVVLLLQLAVPVWATQHTAGISVTVTPKKIAISVSPNTYNYPMLELHDTSTHAAGTDSTETTTTFTVTNQGNVNEQFYVKGADAVDSGSHSWTLAAGAGVGADRYAHDWKGGSGGTYADLTTSNVLASGTIAPSGTVSDYRFKIHMPSSTGSYLAHSTSVTFTATE